MMARAQPILEEVDFFGMEKESASNPKPRLDRRLSIRGLQNAISRINPEVLKSVIASGASAAASTSTAAPAPPANRASAAAFAPITAFSATGDFSALPVYTPPPPFMKKAEKTEQISCAPMTIFYNGTVTVVDVPEDEAENILKAAMMAETSKNKEVDKKDKAAAAEDFLEQLNDGGVPQRRRKSLGRFLGMRKERLMSAWPYTTPKAKEGI